MPCFLCYNRKAEVKQEPLLDVSLTHPRAATYVTDAAAMQGSAAVKGDALKYWGHSGHYHPGYTFIPAAVETYGYLGKPLVRYLNTLSEGQQ